MAKKKKEEPVLDFESTEETTAELTNGKGEDEDE